MMADDDGCDPVVAEPATEAEEGPPAEANADGGEELAPAGTSPFEAAAPSADSDEAAAVARQLGCLPMAAQRRLIDAWIRDHQHTHIANAVRPITPSTASLATDSPPSSPENLPWTPISASLLVHVQAPEGLAGIVLILRRLRASLSDSKLAFVTAVEQSLTTILLLSPTFMLRSTRPRSIVVGAAPHLIMNRTNSNYSFLSVATTSSSVSSSDDASHADPPSTLSLVLAAMRSLTAAVEAFISEGDGDGDMSADEEKLYQQCNAVAIAVRKLKDWESGVGRWEDARGIYAAMVTCGVALVSGIVGILDPNHTSSPSNTASSLAAASGKLRNSSTTDDVDGVSHGLGSGKRKSSSMTSRLRSLFSNTLSGSKGGGEILSKRRSMSSFSLSSSSSSSPRGRSTDLLTKRSSTFAGDLVASRTHEGRSTIDAPRLPEIARDPEAYALLQRPQVRPATSMDFVPERPTPIEVVLERPATAMDFTSAQRHDIFSTRSLSHGELVALKQKGIMTALTLSKSKETDVADVASQLSLTSRGPPQTLSTFEPESTLDATTPPQNQLHQQSQQRPDRWSRLLVELTKNSNAALERLTISTLDSSQFMELQPQPQQRKDGDASSSNKNESGEDETDTVRDEEVLLTLRRALAAIHKKHENGDAPTSTAAHVEAVPDVPPVVTSPTHRFPSLRVIDARGANQIPTYDSQGRRIGTLDHGRFISTTPSTTTAIAGTETAMSTSTITVRGNFLHLSDVTTPNALTMELQSGRLQITSGTLEKLLLRLADENVQDMEFVDVFLLSHGFFISSADLLECLWARYGVTLVGGESIEELEYFNKWRRPIQLKALTVICRWVKLQFEIFAADEKLRGRLNDLIAQVWADGFRTEADRIRRTATSQASTIAQRTMQAPPPINTLYSDAKPVVPIAFPEARRASSSSVRSLESTTPFLNLDAREIARYMTVSDRNAFMALGVVDFVAKLEGSNVVGGGERIDMFAARANMIRNWVALEVCCIRNIKLRRKAVEKFISIAKHCLDLNNFHTSMIITSGLLSAPVQRLKRTWDGLNKSDLTRLVHLESLLDPSSNMRALRRAQAAAGTFLPFFPLVMKDLTFLNEGNAVSSDGRVQIGMCRSLMGILRGYGVSWGGVRDRFVIDSAAVIGPAVGEGLSVPVFVEGRLAAAGDDDKAMEIAWSHTVGIGGEDISAS